MTLPQVHTKVRVSEIAADRGVHRAFRWFHLHEMQIMHWQRSLTEIPAPQFAETARATWLRDHFIELGLSNAQIDPEGNVLGMYTADSEPTAQCLVIDAHVDTIFPTGTPVNVREGDGRFHAPGISDNGCGLAALLAIV